MSTLQPPPPRRPMPPSYLYHDTCALCWERCSDFDNAITRWMHRRQWGHNPQGLQALQRKPDGMAEREWQGRRYR